MSRVFVHGIGAVSPAGIGVGALRNALQRGESWPANELARPGWDKSLRVRQVPLFQPRPGWLGHPRLRRSSPISQHAVAAGIEALGTDAEAVRSGAIRLGIVLCVMSGCVNYSRRFYDEVLKDPAVASPLLFPETVFNAPASHLAALLGTTAINYTLVGDAGTFLQGLALAADWLDSDQVDGCLVIAAEEIDWLTADAFRLFHRDMIMSDGAGAVYLRRESRPEWPVELSAVTSSHPFTHQQPRIESARRMRAELPETAPHRLLCHGAQGLHVLDAAELSAWSEWTGPRLGVKQIFGEGLTAAAAWQCVAGIDALRSGHHGEAIISVVGSNQQAIGAQFVRVSEPKSLTS